MSITEHTLGNKSCRRLHYLNFMMYSLVLTNSQSLKAAMELTHLTHETLETTKQTWIAAAAQAPHEAFLAEYQQLFDVIESGDSIGALDGRMKTSIYYAVKIEGCHKALVQMVQSKRGSDIWIKMMDLYMCPEVELSMDTEQSTVDRLKIFTTALLGVFSLTATLGRADTVKVYGRTEALVTFLRGMHDSLSVLSSLGNMPGIDVSIEGRWLVFRAGRSPL